MARLQYADPNDSATQGLVDRIVAQRGSLLHLYQMLLHSPPVADGWLTFMTAVRHSSQLSGALRELVIMRIAILNGAPYEMTRAGLVSRPCCTKLLTSRARGGSSAGTASRPLPADRNKRAVPPPVRQCRRTAT